MAGNPMTMPLRALFLIFLVACCAWCANVKLYMKDGTSHLVREYQVQPDRVKYYSVERADWEEVPLELVDLKKTESEVQQREKTLKEESAAQDEEEKAIKAQRHEVEQIPVENGVFW